MAGSNGYEEIRQEDLKPLRSMKTSIRRRFKNFPEAQVIPMFRNLILCTLLRHPSQTSWTIACLHWDLSWESEFKYHYGKLLLLLTSH